MLVALDLGLSRIVASMKSAGATNTIPFVLLVFLWGCGDAQDVPTVVYITRFDNSKIAAVDGVLSEVAKKWKLRPFRKDREEMKLLTAGKDSFFVALYFEKDPVISVTNVWVGTVLMLSVSHYGRMPRDELNRAASEIVLALRNRLDIELKLDGPSTQSRHLN